MGDFYKSYKNEQSKVNMYFKNKTLDDKLRCTPNFYRQIYHIKISNKKV